MLLALVLAAIEGIAALATFLAPPGVRDELAPLTVRNEQLRETISRMLEPDSSRLAVFDARLGWRPRPGLDNGVDRIDGRGLRRDGELEPSPPPGMRRVAVFGDSFVYGSEVAGDEAWPAIAERLGTNLEVLNFGVPGYGPDQAYLRFLAEAQSVHPEIAVLTVATPALDRILTVSAAFQAERPHFLAKPRFELDARGELVLVPNPLAKLEDARRFLDHPEAIRELGAHDYWYEPLVYRNPLYDHSYTVRALVRLGGNLWRRALDPDRPLRGGAGRGAFNESSSAFRILQRLLERFAGEARARGMRPLVVLLPDGYSVLRSRAGEAGILDPLARWCVSLPAPCLDAGAAFSGPAEAPEDWFVGRFHYSPSGNARVAEWFVGALASALPAAPAAAAASVAAP